MREPVIEDAIELAAKNFGRMLNAFYPAQGEEGFSERNLTFQFAHAFLELNKGANTFMEVPCLKPGTDLWHHHIDGYVFTPEVGAFVESKRLEYRESRIKAPYAST